MNQFHQLAERIRKNEPIPLVLSLVLFAATFVVRLGMWTRLRGRRVRVKARVISFGNITAGGTGKTPAVIERARREIATGKKVAVLTRGYGTANQDKLTMVDTSVPVGRLDELVGDEAALIARKAPGVVIARCADRVTAARAAIDKYGCDTLILDDGFQYVRLERDENVLVVDAANPFGNGHRVPRGILREPLEAMGRATAIIATRCDQAADLCGLVEQLKAICPDAPIRKTRHAPKSLWRVADGEIMPLTDLAGREIRAVCAIGNPESFWKTLESLGAIITERTALPDHAAISHSVMCSPQLTVCTEKDAARLESAPVNLYALCVELTDL